MLTLAGSLHGTQSAGFATLIIILPSSHAGSQFHVSHTGSTRTFAFANRSSTDICAVAWYHETEHHVEPITSGFQLSLTFNLLPTSSAIPRLPVIPLALSHLRTVLRRWANNDYTDHWGLKIIALAFHHEYGTQHPTIESLKGEDAHKVSLLRIVAEEMGYVVGFAVFIDKDLGIRNRLRRCDEYCCFCEQQTDEMAEMPWSIEKFIGLDGAPLPKFENVKLMLRETNVILDECVVRHKMLGEIINYICSHPHMTISSSVLGGQDRVSKEHGNDGDHLTWCVLAIGLTCSLFSGSATGAVSVSQKSRTFSLAFCILCTLHYAATPQQPFTRQNSREHRDG